MAHAVETCPGWRHAPYTMDALGQARCSHCHWSWRAHRHYGRPHPADQPDDYDIDDPIIRAMWQIDDEDEQPPAGQGSGDE